MRSLSRLHYSVHGGVQRRNFRPGFAVLLFLFVTGSVLSTTIHLVSAAHASTADEQIITSHQTASATPTELTADPALVIVPSQSSQLPTKMLQAVTAATAQNHATSWGVSVYDITNKQWLAQVNADQQMSSASLYKLYAAYALSKTVPFAQWSTKTVAGRPLATCVDLMLRISDNTCGDGIGTMLGWGTIDRFDHAYGFNETVVNLKSGPITTANDTTTYMSDLYQGKLFDAATTSFVLNSLQHQVYRSGIPAGCPDCTVYNKTGNDPGVTHDAAIVTSGNETYAVTIMSEGGNYAEIANVEKSINAVFQP